jgi:hypothetical protein
LRRSSSGNYCSFNVSRSFVFVNHPAFEGLLGVEEEEGENFFDQIAFRAFAPNDGPSPEKLLDVVMKELHDTIIPGNAKEIMGTLSLARTLFGAGAIPGARLLIHDERPFALGRRVELVTADAVLFSHKASRREYR